MPERQRDPALMSGRELDQKCYRRSPQQVEDERREIEARERAAFVASIQPSDDRLAQQPRSVVGDVTEMFDALRNDAKVPLPPPGMEMLPGVGPAWKATATLQQMPKIARPSTAETYIPIVGPGWEAASDLQDGDYGGAAFNAAMAVLDLLPVGTAVKGIRSATKGIGLVKKGSVTADAARKTMRARGVAVRGEEIHHTVPLNGTGRNVQDWRNHYPFLKVLPTDVHRRLTGSWAGAPRYDPIRRIWYGTTDWMKTVPAGIAGYVADSVDNLNRRPQPSPPHRPVERH